MIRRALGAEPPPVAVTSTRQAAMSMQSYLDEIADERTPLRTARLSLLSHLDGEDRERFADRWPGLPPARRLAVLERITELADDNPELNFDAVYTTALRDSEPAARRLAIEGLWEDQERDVIPDFVRLVRDDPDESVRSTAALALGRFVLLGEYGDVRPRDLVLVTDTLRGVATDPAESPDVRGRAVEAAGASSQPWARDLIEEAYSSGDDRLVASAVHAMGRSADSYWLPTLLQELDSGDPLLRYEAAGALGAIGDDEAVAFLAEHLDDEDSEVQEAAIAALGEIGGDDAITVLRNRLQLDGASHQDALEAALEQAEFGNDPLGLRP